MNNSIQLFLVVIFASNIFAARELIITPVRQEQTNICWAACCNMVFTAYKFSPIPSQGKIILWAVAGQNVGNEFTGRPTAVDKVLQNYQPPLYTTYTGPNQDGYGNLSQKDLIEQIDQGRPIIMDWIFGSNSKHSMLITGYTGSGTGSGGSNAGSVVYNDPQFITNPSPLTWEGRRQVRIYAEFVRRGNEYVWRETLRLITPPRSPINSGTGSNEIVRVESGTGEITQSPQSLSYYAKKYGTHIPTMWKWKLIFPYSDGDYTAASWTVSSSSMSSTWNIPNFTLPSGYRWSYNFDGIIPGRVEVVVDDNAGPPSHTDGINVLFKPSNLYPGTLIYENKNISSSQPDVKAHELVIMQNDQFSPGANISIKAGSRIDITTGISIQNGSTTNIVVDPSLR